MILCDYIVPFFVFSWRGAWRYDRILERDGVRRPINVSALPRRKRQLAPFATVAVLVARFIASTGRVGSELPHRDKRMEGADCADLYSWIPVPIVLHAPSDGCVIKISRLMLVSAMRIPSSPRAI